MPREQFMRLAIEKAREGAAQGQWPYGACLVKGEDVISCVYNVTRVNLDPTGHAETHALRESCSQLNSLDLTGCDIYATCEPCPMCFTACHIAKVSSIIYGVNLDDAPNVAGRSQVIASNQMKELLGSPIQLIGGFLRTEALKLFSV